MSELGPDLTLIIARRLTFNRHTLLFNNTQKLDEHARLGGRWISAINGAFF
jgi:hypothetical protein